MGIVTNATNKNQACIDACNRCAQACLECFVECLNEPDVAARKDHIMMLLDCAKMCEMSTCLMSTNSQFAMEHCKDCATVCEKCEQGCTVFKQDDHCHKCADECRKCAEECRNMSNM